MGRVTLVHTETPDELAVRLAEVDARTKDMHAAGYSNCPHGDVRKQLDEKGKDRMYMPDLGCSPDRCDGTGRWPLRATRIVNGALVSTPPNVPGSRVVFGVPQTIADFERRVPCGEIYRDLATGRWRALARAADTLVGQEFEAEDETAAIAYAWASYHAYWNQPTQDETRIWRWPNGLACAMRGLETGADARDLFSSLFAGVDPGAVDASQHPPLVGYDRPLGPDGPKAWWREFTFQDGTTARDRWPDAARWVGP